MFNRTRALRASYALTSALFAGSLATASAAAAADVQHVRGTITKVDATAITVTAGGSNVVVAVPAATKIGGVVPGNLDAIKPGTFIGTANAPKNGTAQALEVVIFPASMKGTGLGDYPWDLPANGSSSSSMTNGTVGSMGHGSAMTNGTVHAMSGSHVLTVDYGKGSKQIAVPANAPVVAIQPATRKNLVNGAHVFVVAGKSGSALAAKFVLVGLNGTIPPM